MTYSLKAALIGFLMVLPVAVACGSSAPAATPTANPISSAASLPRSKPAGQTSPTSTPPPAGAPTIEIIPSPFPPPTVTHHQAPTQAAVTLTNPTVVTDVQAPTPNPVTLENPTAAPAQTPTPTAIPTPKPTPSAIPSPTPNPTATPTAVPPATPSWVRPTGYDIFAPGGLNGDCESDPEPVFSEHITDLSLIDSLTPAGTVQGGDLKPHGYLGNKPSALEVPVYAPVDSYLLDYAYYTQSGFGADDAIYQLKFQVSCEVAYYFDHLNSVAPEIKELIPGLAAENSHGTPINPPLFLKAGDLIGYTGGTPLSSNWDFGVLNTQVWNDLPPKETYIYSPNAEKYRFAVCQYQYFLEDIRQQYLAMLGNQGCGP